MRFLSDELVVLRDWTRELYIRRANARKLLRRLAAEVREEPEEKGKSGTENQAGDEGEIESGVFAAVDDVSGEFPQAKREFGTEIEERA